MSITFFKPKRTELVSDKGYWNNQEIADFYRAMDILKQAGLNTEIDSGVIGPQRPAPGGSMNSARPGAAIALSTIVVLLHSEILPDFTVCVEL